MLLFLRNREGIGTDGKPWCDYLSGSSFWFGFALIIGDDYSPVWQDNRQRKADPHKPTLNQES